MRYRLSSFAPALAAFTIALAASADGYDVLDKPNPPELKFTAVGPGGLKINGAADNLRTIEEGDKIVFKASLKNIKTGIGLRDNHTKKYLGVADWPDASLTLQKSAIKLPEDGKKTSGSAPGKFRLHGVDKDKVMVAYTIERHGSEYSVEGHFNVNIEEHKIEKPCYLGVCVDTKVKVDAKFRLHAK